MTDKKEEVKKPELTNEQITNLINVVMNFKGYSIQEAAYMNEVCGILKQMMK